jgi:3-methyladenine DNA glycosylase AlkD
MIELLESKLRKAVNKKQAKLLQRYFKTGKGEYGEGDVFLGLTVPQSRKIAKEFYDLNFLGLQELLDSEVHEKRFIALCILIERFKRNDKERKKIFEFYLKNAHNNRINNWDLIDLSCKEIVGEFLLDKPRDLLFKLAKSNNLWERRIAIISTFAFIRKNELTDTIRISEILLGDKHDLIHKAVGWALREVGKKDVSVLRKFLDKHSREMPRTILRYAIEKFGEKERLSYLKKS